MNILKKAAACFAAAAVMTSMAVTASADYQIEGQDGNSAYFLKISGIPQDVFKLPMVMLTMTFDNGGDASTQKAIQYAYAPSTKKSTCKIIDISNNEYGTLKNGFFLLDNGEVGIVIEFDKDNEYLAEFIKCTEGGLGVQGLCGDGNGGTQFIFFNSKGNTRAEAYVEPVSFTWQAISTEDNSNNSTSSEASGYVEPEPTSSETSGYVEPAESESTSSEPVSEPVSSEPSATQPSNVDTGAAGVAAVMGTALLAAGAVIVGRKR